MGIVVEGFFIRKQIQYRLIFLFVIVLIAGLSACEGNGKNKEGDTAIATEITVEKIENLPIDFVMEMDMVEAIMM